MSPRPPCPRYRHSPSPYLTIHDAGPSIWPDTPVPAMIRGKAVTLSWEESMFDALQPGYSAEWKCLTLCRATTEQIAAAGRSPWNPAGGPAACGV
jgi:hypothetical protein